MPRPVPSTWILDGCLADLSPDGPVDAIPDGVERPCLLEGGLDRARPGLLLCAFWSVVDSEVRWRLDFDPGAPGCWQARWRRSSWPSAWAARRRRRAT